VDALGDVVANGLKQRMSGRHPLQRGIARKKRFIEDNLLVFAAEPAEARFLSFACGLKRTRHLSNPVDVPIFLDRSRVDARNGAGSDEEIFDHLRNQSSLAGFRRLTEK